MSELRETNRALWVTVETFEMAQKTTLLVKESTFVCLEHVTVVEVKCGRSAS